MLAFIIFLNGLCVMVVEMAGARLLAPWLGTSLIVWTSLIGIILASLSIGNFLGGRFADAIVQKSDNTAHQSAHTPLLRARDRLSQLLLAASASVILCVLLEGPLLNWVSELSFSLYSKALIATTSLFVLPGILCGLISPFITRIAIIDPTLSGHVIGKMNALATMGSIVGTFLGGFVLISFFSTQQIFYGVAACFFVASLITRCNRLRQKGLVASVIILALVFHAGMFATSNEGSIRTIQTRYNTVKIIDASLAGREVTLMQTDPGSFQSATFVDAPDELVFPYTQYYTLGPLARPNAQKILMLGGGAYSIPKWLLNSSNLNKNKDLHLDVVELDPGITDVAGQFFYAPLDDPRMHIFSEDARFFMNKKVHDIQQGEKKYDLIFTDVFNSYYSIPFHVGTIEATQAIKSLLADDGIVIMNTISSVEGDNSRLFRALYSAFRQEFPTVQFFPVHAPDSPDSVQNIMIVASKQHEPPFQHIVDTKAAQLLLNERNLQKSTPLSSDSGLLQTGAIKQRSTDPKKLPDSGVPALKDNYAPVERYTLGLAL